MRQREPCRVSAFVSQAVGRRCDCSDEKGHSFLVLSVLRFCAKIPISVCHRFSCECDKDKQRWIHTVLSSGPIFSTGKGEDDSKGSFSDSERKE